ncbi:vitamin K-dependent gamma-carboxylase-like protein [Algoriphagus yeomjeoni]|uniref:Vitamin K-dependent gamma-carboxylase-like protein n=2 Tax=Algoriphagus yeomjeoni TaxID=291403 RepID=A0A327P3D3_9BACT|nr:vitamin K-dependent gamma-carboxylase-like protein [Algoriphagus yeomjeoni]
MFISVIRFVLNGWIKTQYIDPEFHFSYYGFFWISNPGEAGIYLLFTIMALTSLGVTLGLFYRISAVLFFISFTYVELIDVTNYLNHYYFVSLVAFLMIWMPAHLGFSFDSRRKGFSITQIPYGYVLIIQLLLSMVYFYAGLAKLNPEWMLEALPLRIWLPMYSHLPLVGGLMNELWMAYAFSWFGAIYDLSIPFLLFYSRTRPYAFIAVVVFHISTWLLFPIGMFPFIMILATTIFFSPKSHKKVLSHLKSIFSQKGFLNPISRRTLYKTNYQKLIWSIFTVFLIVQMALPLRAFLYPGKLFWTEQGYRFSWRVMLIEKAGYAIFHIKDKKTGREWEDYASDHLSAMQTKQMSTQPDLILQFVHYLKQRWADQGYEDVEIRAEVYVSLNGGVNRLLVDSNIDLTQIKDSFGHKTWILPY